MMYNPQLDTFICVVEAGSFSKAADKLYISPPAVIKQIIRWRAAWDYSCLTGATGDCK